VAGGEKWKGEDSSDVGRLMPDELGKSCLFNQLKFDAMI
jgi:hypothetical protein